MAAPKAVKPEVTVQEQLEKSIKKLAGAGRALNALAKMFADNGSIARFHKRYAVWEEDMQEAADEYGAALKRIQDAAK